MTQSSENDPLLERAAQGDAAVSEMLFSQHTARLKSMTNLRLHRRHRGRLDPSDVLQEAFLEVSRHWNECVQSPPQPFFLWLRKITINKLAEMHRHHLDVQARDVYREVSILGLGEPAAGSVSLAAPLIAGITSPSQAAIKAEERFNLQKVLDELDPLDREVIALRHFEQFDSQETADVLGLSKSGASSRYIRAMQRLHAVLLETDPEESRAAGEN